MIDGFRQSQCFGCDSLFFPQGDKIPVRVSCCRESVVEIRVECFIGDPPVVLSEIHKPLIERAAGSVQQGMINHQAEERGERRIVNNMCLRRGLALHVERDRVAGSERQLLLPSCLQNRRRSDDYRNSRHADGVQWIYNAIPAQVD